VTFTNESVREFQSALRDYIASTKRALPDIINQRALNVAGRAFDILPPATGAGVDSKRREVRAYMTEQLSQTVKYRKKSRDVRKWRDIFGPLMPGQGRSESVVVKRLEKGWQATKVGKKSAPRQLQRRHLIAQAIAKKEGRKGLYGPTMKAAAARLLRAAVGGVGFLKSAFLPAIYTLNRTARQKFPHRKTFNIKRWSGSGGWGSAQSAKPGSIAASQFSVNVRLVPRSAYTSGRVRNMMDGAVYRAMNEEAEEMRQHVARKLQQRAYRHMVPSLRRSI
jgi:hypothetical protein